MASIVPTAACVQYRPRSRSHAAAALTHTFNNQAKSSDGGKNKAIVMNL